MIIGFGLFHMYIGIHMYMCMLPVMWFSGNWLCFTRWQFGRTKHNVQVHACGSKSLFNNYTDMQPTIGWGKGTIYKNSRSVRPVPDVHKKETTCSSTCIHNEFVYVPYLHLFSQETKFHGLPSNPGNVAMCKIFNTCGSCCSKLKSAGSLKVLFL